MVESFRNNLVAAPGRRHPRLRPTRVSIIQVSLNKNLDIRIEPIAYHPTMTAIRACWNYPSNNEEEGGGA